MFPFDDLPDFGPGERMTWAFARRVGLLRYAVLLLLTVPVGIMAAYRRQIDQWAKSIETTRTTRRTNQ